MIFNIKYSNPSYFRDITNYMRGHNFTRIVNNSIKRAYRLANKPTLKQINIKYIN